MAYLGLLSAKVRSRAWTPPKAEAWMVRSAWSKKPVTMETGRYSPWRVTIEPAVGNETNARTWRAFFAALKGPINTFGLPVLSQDQHAYANVIAQDGAGAAGSVATNLKGGPASISGFLKAGQHLTFILTDGSYQLVTLTADVTTDNTGDMTAAFEPPLRGGVADNAGVEAKNPYAVLKVISDISGWSDQPGSIFTHGAFQAEECWDAP